MTEWKMTKTEQKEMQRITSRKNSLAILIESLMVISAEILISQEHW